MPLLRHINCLFIHIPKNAGRSVENALLPSGLTAKAGSRNRLNQAARVLQKLTNNRKALDFLVGTLDYPLSAAHVTLSEIEILGLIPANELKSLTKFCVVRNPYERTVSSLLHFAGKTIRGGTPIPKINDSNDFEAALNIWLNLDTLDHNVRAHRRLQGEYLQSVAGNQIDYIMRFETLNDDFDRFASMIGQAHAKIGWVGGSQIKHKDYSSLYTPQCRKLVESIYTEDIDRFKYKYPYS